MLGTFGPVIADFYPRPPRGGRLRIVLMAPVASDFYPRPPRGGRLANGGFTDGSREFLSTPSARRATRVQLPYLHRKTNFYPRPPRGGRRSTNGATKYDDVFLSTPSARRATQGHSLLAKSKQISIHALREEGDAQRGWSRATPKYFYPRPPRGGRRCAALCIDFFVQFLSTPSARRATQCSQSSLFGTKNFYPRPPRGGRQSNSNV